MTVPQFLRSLLLASLCLACGDVAAQQASTHGSGNATLRIGIRILHNCEISADGNGQPGRPMVACSQSLPYQANIDGRPAASNEVALALSLTTATLPSNRARYATVAF